MKLILSSLVLISVVILIAILNGKQRAPGKGAYKSKGLLTENEKEFFGRLKQAFPDHHVFTQVALGALLQPAVRQDSREYYRIRGTFSQKIADFVICDDALRVVAIIELDDRTHNSEKDAKRDAMLNQAGYKVYRWNSRNKPAVDDIRREVLGSAAG